MKKFLKSKKTWVAAAMALILAMGGATYAWFTHYAVGELGNMKLGEIKVSMDSGVFIPWLDGRKADSYSWLSLSDLDISSLDPSNAEDALLLLRYKQIIEGDLYSHGSIDADVYKHIPLIQKLKPGDPAYYVGFKVVNEGDAAFVKLPDALDNLLLVKYNGLDKVTPLPPNPDGSNNQWFPYNALPFGYYNTFDVTQHVWYKDNPYWVGSTNPAVARKTPIALTFSDWKKIDLGIITTADDPVSLNPVTRAELLATGTNHSIPAGKFNDRIWSDIPGESVAFDLAPDIGKETFDGVALTGFNYYSFHTDSYLDVWSGELDPWDSNYYAQAPLARDEWDWDEDFAYFDGAALFRDNLNGGLYAYMLPGDEFSLMYELEIEKWANNSFQQADILLARSAATLAVQPNDEAFKDFFGFGFIEEVNSGRFFVPSDAIAGAGGARFFRWTP